MSPHQGYGASMAFTLTQLPASMSTFGRQVPPVRPKPVPSPAYTPNTPEPPDTLPPPPSANGGVLTDLRDGGTHGCDRPHDEVLQEDGVLHDAGSGAQ